MSGIRKAIEIEVVGAASEDEAAVIRQALGGMFWGKQYYSYDVQRWLDGGLILVSDRYTASSIAYVFPTPAFEPFEQPVIAHGKVRYVGEIVAAVPFISPIAVARASSIMPRTASISRRMPVSLASSDSRIACAASRASI